MRSSSTGHCGYFRQEPLFRHGERNVQQLWRWQTPTRPSSGLGVLTRCERMTPSSSRTRLCGALCKGKGTLGKRCHGWGQLRHVRTMLKTLPCCWWLDFRKRSWGNVEAICVFIELVCKYTIMHKMTQSNSTSLLLIVNCPQCYSWLCSLQHSCRIDLREQWIALIYLDHPIC